MKYLDTLAIRQEYLEYKKAFRSPSKFIRLKITNEIGEQIAKQYKKPWFIFKRSPYANRGSYWILEAMGELYRLWLQDKPITITSVDYKKRPILSYLILVKSISLYKLFIVQELRPFVKTLQDLNPHALTIDSWLVRSEQKIALANALHDWQELTESELKQLKSGLDAATEENLFSVLDRIQEKS